MGGSFKIGRAFGIDVKVHWTFFLLLAFFFFLGYQGAGGLVGALTTSVIIVALFFCVLLHEFGHSIVAQRLGIEVPDITLLPIGGLARLKTLPENPWDEVKIAIAGPLVNVVLAPIFFIAAALIGADLLRPVNVLEGGASVGQIIAYLGIINIALATFNLIPAFPMDGGRILRGLLATRYGAVRSTGTASTVGQVFAVGFFILAFTTNSFMLALIAVFIFFGASGEAGLVRQREMMRGLTVADVMGTKRRTETVTPYHNFGQVFDAVLFTDGNRILQESGLRALPVVKNGDLVGMLTTDDIGQAALLRDRRKLTQ